MPRKTNPELVLLFHHDLSAASVVNAVHGRVFGLVRQLQMRELLETHDWTAALIGEAGRLVDSKSPWAKVDGVVANFLLTATRLGWQVDEDGAVKVQGCWFRLQDLSKLELKRLVRSESSNWVCKRAGGGEDVLGLGVVLAKQLQRRLNPLQVYMLVKLLSRGVWTARDKWKRNLAETELCPWCGMVDTLRHHVLDCARHANRNGQKLRGNPGVVLDELCGTAIGETRLWPPAKWFQARQGPEVTTRSKGSASFPVSGLVWFTDGSAMYPGHRILRRAAWGAIAFGAEGINTVAKISGIVQPRPYTAQTVYEAELQAIVEVLEITVGPLVLFTDCQTVQQQFVSQ
eukprot:6481176-Amphidinium_carterae.1